VLVWVTWVFAAAPTLCLGGYIACPWTRADHRAESSHSNSCCPASSDSSRPDSSQSDNRFPQDDPCKALPQGDPCKAQTTETKERVAEQSSMLLHLSIFTCPTILHSTAMGLSNGVTEALAFNSTADPFASRGLPLLL